MKIVIFGLTITSSWGNGHATIWRGVTRALIDRGHRIVFFERDTPYYAGHRDLTELPGAEIVLYPEWTDVLPLARHHLADADVGMVTSYCPDGVIASEAVLDSSAALRTFYDLDTPVTLQYVREGQPQSYIGPRGLGDFDLVLSYTGGKAVDELQRQLGARRVAVLYGSVDPTVHRPTAAAPQYCGDLSYLGTYAADRQAALDALLIEPARRLPDQRFVIGGALYPHSFPWTPNIFFVRHLPPSEHPAFFCSSRLTLNVTRQAMAEMGYCPSGRLFEAAACGTPILSDWWEGLDSFFSPREEILIARDTADAIAILRQPPEELERVAQRARQRTLDEHTAAHRAAELETILSTAQRRVASGIAVDSQLPKEAL